MPKKNNLPGGRQVSGGVVHTLPEDMRKALETDKKSLAAWEDITPLARNEWICWVTIAKLPETRSEHIARMRSELKEGKRRPCCWPGCPHRNAKAKKWFRGKIPPAN